MLHPTLSCGMTAELIPEITRRFGIDYMANVERCNTRATLNTKMRAGAQKLRDAIDKVKQ